MKHIKRTFYTTSVLILTLMFIGVSGCKDVTDPPNPNEEELITSVVLQFTDTATQEMYSFKFADPDGAGGNAPAQFDTITLDSQSVYTVLVQFLDESGETVEDITEEVEEEAEDHIICYELTGQGSIEVTDKDANDLPLGLEALLETKSSEEGTLTLSLKHQPEIKNGLCDLGETDVEVSFMLKVE